VSAILFFAVTPAAQAAGETDVPHYVNDPSWPKPFAHHWVMGQIGGLTVDDHDRIWVLQRALPYAVDEQGVKHDLAPADRMPAVMVFDGAGRVMCPTGRNPSTGFGWTGAAMSGLAAMRPAIARC
jgi:hypothetical protein